MDSEQMFLDLMSILMSKLPKSSYGDRRRVEVLAWAVAAVCLTCTVNLSLWGEVVISEAKIARSRERRFSRWLHNPKIDPHLIYRFLLQDALSDWPTDQPYYVALDTSDLGNGYILIRTALIYRGRAIPISWDVIKHGSTSVSYPRYEPVLEQVLNILPKGANIIFLADRGFAHKKFIEFCAKHQVHFRIRIKSDTLIKWPDRRVMNVNALRPPKGEAHFYQEVFIIADEIGPINLAVAYARDGKEPWYIMTDQKADVQTLDEYALRFDIEENFLDDKSNGFQVESSRVKDESALSRLFLVLAVATLYFTTVGVGVVHLKKRRWVDTHWDRGISYFQIGWRWLRQQFRRGWMKINWFWLDPTADPEPAIASRRKGRVKRKWIVVYWLPP